MKIAISGNSGFIGQHLTDFFSGRGDVIVPLKHSMFLLGNDDKLKEALTGCDVVINLAGTTINQRWTSKAKREIRNSRVCTTRRLVSIINEMPVKPDLFISASAVGIYPDKGIYSETSTSEGSGFLAEVCIRWEEEAQKLSRDVRLVITRFGVVLSNDGGALPKMLLPFRFFVGGKIASGKQGFSWIHIEDVLNAIRFVIEHKDLFRCRESGRSPAVDEPCLYPCRSRGITSSGLADHSWESISFFIRGRRGASDQRATGLSCPPAFCRLCVPLFGYTVGTV